MLNTLLGFWSLDVHMLVTPTRLGGRRFDWLCLGDAGTGADAMPGLGEETAGGHREHWVDCRLPTGRPMVWAVECMVTFGLRGRACGSVRCRGDGREAVRLSVTRSFLY